MPASSTGSSGARAHIGTSGWTYDAWRDLLYRDVPRARWLPHYATRFDAVEVNATFYHSLKPTSFAHWREQTPIQFRFAIKANRYLTHVGRLDFPAAALARERRSAMPLGEKLAVVLWQLPAGLHLDLHRLERFLERLSRWPEPRHAIEFRHASWFIEPTVALLSAHRVAACQSDAADWPMWEGVVTTDLVYVRLHGHEATYCSPYSDRALRRWAARVREWQDEGRSVHVYFDNTDLGHAVSNATALARLVAGDADVEISHG
jgi:uncharacterized protein YecE (DUF72 family)